MHPVILQVATQSVRLILSDYLAKLEMSEDNIIWQSVGQGEIEISWYFGEGEPRPKIHTDTGWFAASIAKHCRNAATYC